MAPRDYYNPVAPVAPQMAPTPRIHEDFPHVQISDAVGRALENVGTGYGVLGRAVGEVGQAMDSLGTQTKNAGNELWEKAVALKALESDKKVDDLVIAYNQKQTELGEEFRNRLGVNASPGELTAHLKQGEDLRTGMQKGLTPYEQKRFDGESRGIYQQDASRSITHSSQQFHHGVIKTGSATISMLQQQISRAQTQDQLDKGHEKLDEALIKQSHLEGWTPEEAEFNTYQAKSKATSMWISNRSDEEPTKAMEILESAYKAKNITEEDYDRLHREIKGKVEDYVARNAADRAGQNPERPYAEKEKIAREEAAKLTDDPKAIDKAVQRTKADDSDYHRQKIDQQRRYTDLLDGFAHGRLNPEGKLPTRREEIDIDPRTKEAYAGSDNRVKDAVDKQLIQNSLEKYAETPEEIQRFTDLKERSWDPANYDEFRNLQVSGLHLSNRHRDALIARKEEIVKDGIKAMDNPHVHRAEGILRSNGMIPEAVWKDNDQMNRLRGVLHDEIDLRQKLEKRPMNENEIISLGRDILSSEPWGQFLGMKFGETYQFEKLSDATKKLVQDYKTLHSGMSDDQAMRAVAQATYQAMFKKYHEKGKSAPTGAGPAAPVSQ